MQFADLGEHLIGEVVSAMHFDTVRAFAATSKANAARCAPIIREALECGSLFRAVPYDSVWLIGRVAVISKRSWYDWVYAFLRAIRGQQVRIARKVEFWGDPIDTRAILDELTAPGCRSGTLAEFSAALFAGNWAATAVAPFEIRSALGDLLAFYPECLCESEWSPAWLLAGRNGPHPEVLSSMVMKDAAEIAVATRDPRLTQFCIERGGILELAFARSKCDGKCGTFGLDIVIVRQDTDVRFEDLPVSEPLVPGRCEYVYRGKQCDEKTGCQMCSAHARMITVDIYAEGGALCMKLASSRPRGCLASVCRCYSVRVWRDGASDEWSRAIEATAEQIWVLT